MSRVGRDYSGYKENGLEVCLRVGTIRNATNEVRTVWLTDVNGSKVFLRSNEIPRKVKALKAKPIDDGKRYIIRRVKGSGYDYLHSLDYGGTFSFESHAKEIKGIDLDDVIKSLEEDFPWDEFQVIKVA